MKNNIGCNDFFDLFPSSDIFGFFKGGENDSRYFCTPVGADIIGWTGVDGIHICRIPSLDTDMVFVVNPMSSNNYVYPIARSLSDFLSLILFCTEFSPMEQPVVQEKQFLDFIEEIKKEQTDEKKQALQKLESQLHISPHFSPFQYLYDLQNAFDYNKIPYSKEYFALTDE